jgi:hypothetical protein
MSDVLNHRTRVRTGSRPPQCGASLFFTCALCCSGRRAEAPPLDLRYAGSSQTYLEPGFAESATVPVAL